MFYGRDRQAHRAVFVEAWRKHRAGLVLEPLERLVVEVITEHPHYHEYLTGPEALAAPFAPSGGDANPFLHMGLHIALREQVATDRPPGIAALYARMLRAFGDAHALEHVLMECLGEALWDAQRRGGMPDEARYLRCVRESAMKRGVPSE